MIGGMFLDLNFFKRKNKRREFYHQLYEKYYMRLYSYAYNILLDRSLAEDSVSSAFVSFMKNCESGLHIENETDAIKYLISSVKNAAIDIYRRKKQDACLNLFSVSDFYEEDNGSYSDYDIPDNQTPIDTVIQKEQIKIVLNEIEKLDPLKQQILSMRIFHNMKISEIADRLNMNSSTVSTVLSRIYKKMRKRLEEYFDE